MNSGFRNSYLAASRLGPYFFCSHYSPRFQRIIVKWPGNFITKLVHKTLEVNYAFKICDLWFKICRSVIFRSMPWNVGWAFKIGKVQKSLPPSGGDVTPSDLNTGWLLPKMYLFQVSIWKSRDFTSLSAWKDWKNCHFGLQTMRTQKVHFMKCSVLSVYSFYSQGSKVYTGYVPYVNRGYAKWVSSLSKMINSNFQP